jgi:hypothetical protein
MPLVRLVFQACSFNHSDISPLWNQTTAATRWKIANCVRPPNVPRSLTGMRPPLPARMGERFQYKRSLENETSQVPIRRESTVARAFRSTETLRPRHSGWPRDKRVRWRWRASGGALLPIAGHDEFYDEGETSVSMCEDRSAADAAGAPRWALWGAAAITTLLRPLGVRIHGQG